MEWVEDRILAERILRDISKDIYQEKEVGHTTELIYCLTKGYFNRFYPLPPTMDTTLIFAVGIGLESAMLASHKQHLRGELDGISYEVDVLMYDTDYGEMKSTRLSSNKTPDDGLPETWEEQVLSYMKVRGTTEFNLVVLHLLGNYSPPFPELKVYRLTATQEEIDENWQHLIFRKEVYQEFIEKREIPTPFRYNKEWECEHCQYILVCESVDYKLKQEKEARLNGKSK